MESEFVITEENKRYRSKSITFLSYPAQERLLPLLGLQILILARNRGGKQNLRFSATLPPYIWSKRGI